MRAVVKEKDVQGLFEMIRRTLQIERVAKDQSQFYLFEGKRGEREEVSLKEL